MRDEVAVVEPAQAAAPLSRHTSSIPSLILLTQPTLSFILLHLLPFFPLLLILRAVPLIVYSFAFSLALRPRNI